MLCVDGIFSYWNRRLRRNPDVVRPPRRDETVSDISRRLAERYPGAEWLPRDCSRRERATKALELMKKDQHGVMLLKVLIFTGSRLDEDRKKRLEMIPIRWVNIKKGPSDPWPDPAQHPSARPSRSKRHNLFVDNTAGIVEPKRTREDAAPTHNKATLAEAQHIGQSPESNSNCGTSIGVSGQDGACDGEVGRVDCAPPQPSSAATPQPLAPPPPSRPEAPASCAICFDRLADLQLLPCAHGELCQVCILENICFWDKAEPPNCPLCRAPFHTVVMAT